MVLAVDIYIYCARAWAEGLILMLLLFHIIIALYSQTNFHTTYFEAK